jgi:hypothetical protein
LEIYSNKPANNPKTIKDVPTTTPNFSDEISKDLKKEALNL